MGNIIGDKKTLKQIIREQKRMVQRSIRSLERERDGLKRDEQKLIIEIKKNAKANQMRSVKIQAKDLVRIRKHQEKFVELTAQLRAISLQMTQMASVQALTDSMKQVSKSMVKLNKQVKLPELQKVMQEFAKESEKLEMKQEIMGDAIEDAMDSNEDEEESEQIVSQVLDELGVSVGDQLVDAPGKKLETKEEVPDAADKELEARLNNLKR